MNGLIEKLYYKLQGLRWIITPFIFGQHAAVVEFLVRRYGRHSLKILDLGARRSPYTRSLRRSLIIGLDLPAQDEAILGFSRSSLEKFARDNHLPVFGSGEHLPFQSASFDLVLMIEVIEHIERDGAALQEVEAILKPGGVLVLSTPNGDTFPIPSKHHLRHYSTEKLKEFIANHFEIDHFWALFPKGRLWEESVRSVRTMINDKNIIGILRHILGVWIYWFYTVSWVLSQKTVGTTTLFVVARKKKREIKG